MKARKMIATIGVGAATMAMSLGAQVAPVNQTNQTTVQQEVKATPREEKVRQMHTKHNVGGSGLDLVTHWPNVGLSPKEYGIRYGDGKSRKGKANKLHLKHGYKIKRRAT